MTKMAAQIALDRGEMRITQSTWGANTHTQNTNVVQACVRPAIEYTAPVCNDTASTYKHTQQLPPQTNTASESKATTPQSRCIVCGMRLGGNLNQHLHRRGLPPSAVQHILNTHRITPHILLAPHRHAKHKQQQQAITPSLMRHISQTDSNTTNDSREQHKQQSNSKREGAGPALCGY